MAENEILDAALNYARRGWFVFPLWPNGKKPRIKGGGGLHGATIDEAIIRKWWTQWPNANIGLNCGKSGLVAVDIDVKPDKGVDGFETWGDLRQRHGINDNTYTNMTPTGGAHILYRAPNGSKITNAAGTTLGLGLDVRALGGYIVVPPSVHPNGGTYAWEISNHPDDGPILDLPGQLYELMLATGRAQVADVVGDIIPQGERDQTLTSLAGSMRRRGMGEAEIFAALHVTNDKRCQPPLPDKDIRRITQSVCRYEPHKEPEQPPAPDVPPWEEVQRAKGTWQIYTMEDAYSPRPPLEFLIDELFTLPSVSVVYGPPGSFKSFILADAAMCVALGKSWLLPRPDQQDGAIARPTRRSTVLWCDFDNGRRRTHERIEALGRGHGAETDAPMLYVSMPTPWLDASKPGMIAMLTNYVSDYGVKMVVIDNLGMVTGKVEENSAEMASVLGNFRRLSEETGSAVIIIHHQRKTTGFKSRAGESLRGHSSIEAALDLALLIEREERAKTICMKSTKVRGVDVFPFGAEFSYKHKDGRNELESACFYGVILAGEATRRVVSERIKSYVRQDAGCTKGALVESVKKSHPDIGVNRIGTIIDWVVQVGGISAHPGPNNSIRYFPVPR
jgi:hypothetical protein